MRHAQDTPVYFRVLPGLRKLLREAGIPVALFMERASISKDTWDRLVHGRGVFADATIARVVGGFRDACQGRGLAGGDLASLAFLDLCHELPVGEIRVNGNEEIRLAINTLAQRNNMERFEYVASLFAYGIDPLEAVRQIAERANSSSGRTKGGKARQTLGNDV